MWNQYPENLNRMIYSSQVQKTSLNLSGVCRKKWKLKEKLFNFQINRYTKNIYLYKMMVMGMS